MAEQLADMESWWKRVRQAFKSVVGPLYRRHKFRRRYRKLCAQARQLAAPHARQFPPILVFQMSKVGSSTVYHSLKELALPNPLFHLHFMADEHIDEMESLSLARNPRAQLPDQLILGRKLGNLVRQLGDRRNYKIVTLVRDPIAREVSGVLQIPNLLPQLLNPDGTFHVERTVDYLRRSLCEPDTWIASYPEQWFDRELMAVFGIDIFEHPFDTRRGYEVIHQDGVSVLAMQMEKIDDVMPSALASFLDLDQPVPLVRRNEQLKSSQSEVYRQLLDQVRIPLQTCHSIYGRRFTRHFYSNEMIDSFIRRWASPLDTADVA